MINKIKAWFIALIKGTKKLLDKYLPIAVKIVQAVKKAIDSGTVDVVTDVVKKLIPSQTDDLVIDSVVAFVKKRIPELCIKLEILNVANMANGADELKLSLEALKNTYGDKWDYFMSGLAGDLVEYLSDGKIDAKEAKELAGKFYDKYIKK